MAGNLIRYGKRKSMEQLPDFDKATRRLLFGDERREIPGAGTSAARRPKRHTKVKVTINLDGDIINHFKERSAEDGIGYQLLINRALREAMEGSAPERIAREAGEMLLANESFLEAVAARIKR